MQVFTATYILRCSVFSREKMGILINIGHSKYNKQIVRMTSC
jgi:hypothetical protein